MEVNGRIAGRQGVRVIVMKEPDWNMSDGDMLKIAIELLKEER